MSDWDAGYLNANVGDIGLDDDAIAQLCGKEKKGISASLVPSLELAATPTPPPPATTDRFDVF